MSVPMPREKDRDVGVESHEQRGEHGRAEHRDHVLHAERDGLRGGQTLVGGDDAALAQRPAREIQRVRAWARI